MKSFKWMLAALLAVTVCTPLMAQNHKDLGAKIQRQIQLQKQKQQSAKCWRCGEKIMSESQRCSADCDVYCAPESNTQQAAPKTQKKAKSKKVKKAVKQDYETCPECHAVYDDDYYFHGIHYCGFNH